MRIRTVMAACLVLASPALAKRPPDRAEKNVEDADKMVCKSFVRTGSLADRYRVCHTRREWQNLRDDISEARMNSSGCANPASCGPS